MWHVDRPGSDARSESGFTLIELVVAMVILAAMATAVIGVIMTAQTQGVRNRDRVAAANLAARELDLVREQFATATGPLDLANAGLVVNPHHLTGQVEGQPLVVDGTPYTVKRSAQWNVAGNGASACEGGSLVTYPTLGVTVTVTWGDMGSVQPVVSTAQLAPPKKMGVATTDAFIASKVVDQNAQPLSGIAVSATAGSVSTAYTDATGCAIIRVTPAAVTGTVYTVRVESTGYVDISSTPNPSKTTGAVKQSTIDSSTGFTVGRAGTVTVKLVRPGGGSLSDAEVNGSTVTLVASQYSGASGQTPYQVTRATTTFTGMWPTTYGAFFGTAAPPGGYTAAPLPPGGSITLEAEVAMATIDVQGLPAGTSAVWVYPSSAPSKTCTGGSGGTQLSYSGSPVTFTLLPGSYDFLAAGDAFACSPGPAAQTLVGGDNDALTWASTTLRLQSVPSGAGLKVWAIEKTRSGLASLSTCPTSFGGTARDISGAASGPVELPAGAWYVWQTNGAANGTCTSYPGATSPLATVYGTAVTKTWTTTSVTLQMTGVAKQRWVIVSTGTVSNCKASTYSSTGTTVQSTAQTTADGSTVSLTVARPSANTTYNAYLWNPTSSNGGPACTAAGKYIVGPGSGTLSKTSGTTQVGP